MNKVNSLIKEWMKGMVMLSSALEEKGYRKDLLRKYVRSGLLESLGYGAFKIAGGDVEWYGAVNALQNQKKSIIHPGGKTALTLKGYAHYVSESLSRVDLFGDQDSKLPKWFKGINWGVSINYFQTKLFNYSKSEYYALVRLSNIDVKVSSPEMATMEMLNLVPKAQSFDEALKIMEGLTTLRPQLVQQLLEECNSVKVKRLFLYMAEKNEHQWFQELNIEKINLGSGKRVIVKDGVFDKKYLITVPREYAG